MSIFGSPDLAIDLGTATTRVAGRRDLISLRPSVSRDVPALHRGVIVNVHATTEVLRPMMRNRRGGRMGKLRVLACAPSDVSALERQMVRSCILEAGATSVIVVPEPLAAAVGAGIDIGSPYAKFLIDFGDGVTDCAVIREGQILASLADRVGCSDLRRAVQEFVRERTGMELAAGEAERLLRHRAADRHGLAICRGVSGGAPGRDFVNRAELDAALQPVLDRMLAPMRTLLRSLPPAIGAEVIEDGIFLTGGGALLPGMREAVAQISEIDTRVVPDPMGSVIGGARRMLPFAASLDLWNSWNRRGTVGAGQ